MSVRSPLDADVLEGDEIATCEAFHPEFTYPIFGEQEKIFGYEGLSIKASRYLKFGETRAKETASLRIWQLATVPRRHARQQD